MTFKIRFCSVDNGDESTGVQYAKKPPSKVKRDKKLGIILGAKQERKIQQKISGTVSNPSYQTRVSYIGTLSLMKMSA